MDPPGNRKGTEGENWRLTQEAGGFYPANFIQAYFVKRTQWVSVIFVMFYIKSPTLFFRHPQRKHRHSSPQMSCKFLGGERGCVHIALYPARETPPVFPLPPGTPPYPSLVVGPPQQQRLQPQHRRCLIAPSQPEQPTGIAPDRKRKYTESTHQQPKPSSSNGNI